MTHSTVYNWVLMVWNRISHHQAHKLPHRGSVIYAKKNINITINFYMLITIYAVRSVEFIAMCLCYDATMPRLMMNMTF